MSEELEFKYYAFITYSSTDRHSADWIRRRLERFRIPRNVQSAPNRQPATNFPSHLSGP